MAVVVEKTARDALAWWKSRRPELLENTGARLIVEELRGRFDALEAAILRYDADPTRAHFKAMWDATMEAMISSKGAGPAPAAAGRGTRGEKPS